MTGEFPKYMTDHINGNTEDNSFSNLRESTCSENQKNVKIRTDNISGYKRVTKHGKRWRADATINRKQILIGVFDTPKEASLAYEEFSKKMHGDFYKRTSGGIII